MTIKLDVSYAEKDLAKSKGAKWNPDEKTWFTKDVAKLPGLSKWIRLIMLYAIISTC